MSLNKLRDTAYQTAKEHGFHEVQPEPVPEKLMLIVSELSEALEAHRKGKRADLKAFNDRLSLLNNSHNGILTTEVAQANFEKTFKNQVKDTFEDELADATIRILALSGALGIDLDEHVALKMRYNSGREYKHGKAY